MIVLRPSWGHSTFVFLGALLLVAGGVFVLLLPDASLKVRLAGAFSIPFFGVAGFWSLWRHRRIGLILDQDGIVDRTSLVSVGQIRWDEIADVDLITFGSVTFIGVRRHREDRADDPVSGYPVNLDCTGYGKTPAEILDLIRRYWLNPDRRGELGAMEETRPGPRG